MPAGAWESLHGGSRKWFPEQSADPSLGKRVRVWRPGLPETHPPDGRDSRTSSAGQVDRQAETHRTRDLHVHLLTGGVRRQLVVRSWPRTGARQPGR